MTPKLSEEQKQALAARAGRPIEVEDPETHQVFVLMDSDEYERAVAALRKEADLASIQRGLDDMEAGRYSSLQEAEARMRSKLGLPERQSCRFC